jgi:hypothetical protein
MNGIITTREVFENLALIRREFGTRCCLRCLVALLRGRPTTFLECAVAPMLGAAKTG